MINSIQNMTFKGNLARKTEDENLQQSKKIFNDKKKIVLALAGLAAASIAAIGIAKRSKVPNDLSIDKFKENGSFELGFAKFKNKPYTGTIAVLQGDGKCILEYNKGNLTKSTRYDKMHTNIKEYEIKDGIKTIKQYYQDSEDKIFKTITIEKDGKISSECKDSWWNETLHSSVEKQPDGSVLSKKEIIEMGPSTRSYYIRTINTKTDEVLDSTKLKLYKKSKPKSAGTVRKTQNGVTTVNGKVKSKRTIEFDEAGNKIITVDYGKEGKKIITIASDGTRTVENNTNKMYQL